LENQFVILKDTNIANIFVKEKADLVARAFGYSPEELSSLPTQANMGLSCGNPIAFASLKEVCLILFKFHFFLELKTFLK
jgi:hypothetical protein